MGARIHKHLVYGGDRIVRSHHQETRQDRAGQAFCSPGIKQS